MSRSQPFVTHGAKSAPFQQFGILWQMMATGMQTDGVFCMMDEIMPNLGSGPSTHTHIQDEGLYVVEGEATFNAGGKQGIVACAGTFIAVPKLTEHSFQTNKKNTRLLNFYLPAGFEMVLMGLARPAEKREPPPARSIRETLPPRWVANLLNDEYGTKYKFGQPHSHPDQPQFMLTEPTPGANVFPFAANLSDGRSNLHLKNALWGVLASSIETGGCYSLFDIRSRAGSLYGPRMFPARDTVLFILSGEMTFFLGKRPQQACDGALVWIPRGTIHSIRTDSEQAACLYLQSPGGLEDYLRFVGTPTEKVGPPGKEFEDKVPNQQGIEVCYTSLGIEDIMVQDPLATR